MIVSDGPSLYHVQRERCLKLGKSLRGIDSLADLHLFKENKAKDWCGPIWALANIQHQFHAALLSNPNLVWAVSFQIP